MARAGERPRFLMHGAADGIEQRKRETGVEDAAREPHAPRLTKALHAMVAASCAGFLSASLSSGASNPSTLSASQGEASSMPYGASDGAMVLPTVLPLAQGAHWPAFWEPSGASFWPGQEALLLVAENGLVQVEFQKAPVAVQPGEPFRVLQLPAALADVCVYKDDLWASSSQGLL
ncbi:unnamed protein product, partial [Polarella glacialis]